MDIKQLLKQTNLFDQLNDADLEKICSNLQRVLYSPGELIIREGKIGDSLYVIESGEARVFTQDEHNNEIVLARLVQGQYFGEQALLEEIPKQRNASVVSLSNIQLLKISHGILQDLFQQNNTLREALISIGKEQLLEKLTSQISDLGNIKTQLFDTAKGSIKEFNNQEVIFQEGDPPECVYFILEGKVEIEKHNATVLGNDERIALGSGHIFGEVGVLENKARTGTARAINHVKVLEVAAKEFKESYATSPHLKNLVDALYNTYQIPHLGVITQYQSRFLNTDAINSIFKLENGETVIASRVIDSSLFSIINSNAVSPRVLRYQHGEDIWREALIENEHLVGIRNYGTWDDLGIVSAMVLHKVSLTSQHEHFFLKTGMFSHVTSTLTPTTTFNDQLICECMTVDRDTIVQAINAGATQVEQVSLKTGAGTVCGCCRPKIADMLGKSAWFPAKLSLLKKHTKNVRTYLLKPNNCEFKAPIAGQYIIVQAQINRNWIERAYTITSVQTQESFEITLKCEPFGLFSQWLFHRSHDISLVRISPPLGNFNMDLNKNIPAICFAGGIGITPFLAFLRQLDAIQGQRRIHIEYCVKDVDEYIFKEELESIAQKNPNVSLHFRSDSENGIFKSEEIKTILDHLPLADLYICGPQGFEQLIVTTAKLNNIDDKRIYSEQFIHAGGPLKNYVK